MTAPSEIPSTESAVWREVYEYIERADFNSPTQSTDLKDKLHTDDCSSAIINENSSTIINEIKRSKSSSSSHVSGSEITQDDDFSGNLNQKDIPRTESQVWKRVYDYAQAIDH